MRDRGLSGILIAWLYIVLVWLAVLEGGVPGGGRCGRRTRWRAQSPAAAGV